MSGELQQAPDGRDSAASPRHTADYVARLERVAALAASLMIVAYDDGPEEIALTEALEELEWDMVDGRKTPVCPDDPECQDDQCELAQGHSGSHQEPPAWAALNDGGESRE